MASPGHHELTHWPLGDLDAILKLQFSISFYWLVSSHHLMIVPSDDCHGTSPMISQHWFRWWFGAVRQQAITWTNVDLVPCRHMASPGHNDLTELYVIHHHTAFSAAFIYNFLDSNTADDQMNFWYSKKEKTNEAFEWFSKSFIQYMCITPVFYLNFPWYPSKFPFWGDSDK